MFLELWSISKKPISLFSSVLQPDETWMQNKRALPPKNYAVTEKKKGNNSAVKEFYKSYILQGPY